LGALVSLLALNSSAAPVVWSSVSPAQGPSDIVLPHSGFVGQSGYTGSLTINHYTFDAFGTDDGISIQSFHDPRGYSWSYGVSNAINSVDASYNTLTSWGFYTYRGVTSNITLRALTIGQQYEVELWVGTWDNPFPTWFSAGNAVNMYNTPTVPTYVTGTFFADSSTEVISYYGTSGDFGVVAAVAFSPVPEPATYAGLFGLVALGFARYRRRQPGQAPGPVQGIFVRAGRDLAMM